MLRIFLYVSLLLACTSADNANANEPTQKAAATDAPIITGAEQTAVWLGLLEGKQVGLLVNHSSLVDGVHLLDTMLQLGVSVKAIYSPEHGFRGTADAGEKIADDRDEKSGLQVYSLYGSQRKPSQEILKGIDVMVFDIQDVGARFYTYISTMHYAMEACAEAGIDFVVLDRPNPNGHYVDGPVLQSGYSSFVGMHTVPIVHGMTVGEYARMINGEGWLAEGTTVNLDVVPCKNYDHDTPYELPVRPSPNLPNQISILLYPSLCLFEGTVVSIGRGTTKPFQVIGHPNYPDKAISFTPKSGPGSKYPKLENQTCYGFDYTLMRRDFNTHKFDLSSLLHFHKSLSKTEEGFFLENGFFDKLAGGSDLREQIEAGLSEEEIRLSWQPALELFLQTRAKYLLYTDFTN